MRTSEELNRERDPRIVRAMGAIRRMVIALTDSAIWQITGVRMPDGSTETRRAEVFGGIGIYARPPGAAEAIVASVGDASTPAIVAIRDEGTRAAVAGGVKPDETMLYNSKAVVYVKDDETIEARSVGGAAHSLAFQSKLNALESKVNDLIEKHNTHVHPAPGGATSAILSAIAETPISSSTGTDVLKGE